MANYDAIVLGTGGVGSAALMHLARRGCRVLGVDRFAPPHVFGSSHGQTRILRQAYFEHSDYTPLLLDCYRLWSELAAEIGERLYFETGVLQIGPADGAVVSGVFQAAHLHDLDVERLEPGEIERRWSALKVPRDLIGAYERRAGYLLVEKCVEAHLQVALKAGAEQLCSTEILSWDPGPPVRLRTSAGELQADRLVVTAGAWAGPLLSDLQLQLEVRRKSVFWYSSNDTSESAHRQLPCFLYELPNGVFYGMPQVDERGVKVAEHSGGQKIDDPLEVDRQIDAEDLLRVATFVDGYLPLLASDHREHSVCMYTMSPDQHFVVDRHPAYEHIAFAAGLSGHGFKFAPILGQVLSGLVLDGGTELPIDFLGLR